MPSRRPTWCCWRSAMRAPWIGHGVSSPSSPAASPASPCGPTRWSSWPSRMDACVSGDLRPVVRRADPSAAVPAVPGHRRRGPHPLPPGICLGPGGSAHPVPGHHPCGPLPGRGAGDPGPDRGRDRRADTSGTRAWPSPSCTAPVAWTRRLAGRAGPVTWPVRVGRGRRRGGPQRGGGRGHRADGHPDPGHRPGEPVHRRRRCWFATSTASTARRQRTASNPEVRREPVAADSRGHRFRLGVGEGGARGRGDRSGAGLGRVAVRPRRHRGPAAGRGHSPAPGLGAPGSGRLRGLDGRAVREVLRTSGVDAGDDRGRGHRLHRLHDAAHDRRRHTAVPATGAARPSRTPGSSCGSTTPPSRRRTASTTSRRRGARRGCRATAAGRRPSGSWPSRSRSSTRRPPSMPRPTGSSRRPTGSCGSSPGSRHATAVPRATRRRGHAATASRTRASWVPSTHASRTSSTAACRGTSGPSVSVRERSRQRLQAGPACVPGRRSPSPTWMPTSRCPRWVSRRPDNSSRSWVPAPVTWP